MGGRLEREPRCISCHWCVAESVGQARYGKPIQQVCGSKAEVQVFVTVPATVEKEMEHKAGQVRHFGFRAAKGAPAEGSPPHSIGPAWSPRLRGVGTAES